jgi:exosortase A-associated hydrolase 2
MSETPLFFAQGARKLFGVYHDPAAAAVKTPWVFCHPFGEEKLWTHRVFVAYARRLAAAGHPVLRFDYMGNGDSDGSFSESSLETALADVRRAIAEVRERSRSEMVSLMGLRLGGTIASLVAEDALGIERLALWSPIVDGARYMQELLRINLTTQMAVYKEIRQDRTELVAAMEQGKTVNIDGYEMSLALYAETCAVKLAAESKRFAGPCLVVQIDRQPGRVAGELRHLASTYARGTLTFAQEEPFWKEIPRFYGASPNLFDVTGVWQASS